MTAWGSVKSPGVSPEAKTPQTRAHREMQDACGPRAGPVGAGVPPGVHGCACAGPCAARVRAYVSATGACAYVCV